MNDTPKKLNDCWRDEMRMTSLYSPFRASREVNPQDWDNKQQFWFEVAIDSCREQKEVCFDCNEICERFRMKERRPLGLPTVLKEMLRQGIIQNETDFRYSVEEGWLSWGFGVLIKKPLYWTLSSITGRKNRNLQGTYVVLELLQEKADAIVAEHSKSVEFESTDNIIEYSSLWQKCQHLCKDEKTFELTLLHLRKTKKVCFLKTEDGLQILKFSSPNSKICPEFNEVDVDVFRLKQSIQVMKLHIDRLTNEMERYKMEAVVQLKKGMRTLAKNYLRQKRSIQRTLENKYIALETMETMQRKIQEAHSDIMIIDAYKAGSAALKQTLNINELTPAAVDNAMDEVQEALEAYQEVNDTVMQGNDTISDIAGISKNELEEELELLLAGENESFDDLGISAFDKMNVADTSASDREPNFSDILATSQSTPPHFPSVPTTPPQYDVYKVPAGSSQVHDVYDMRFPDVPSTAMPTSPSSQNYKERNVETIILE